MAGLVIFLPSVLRLIYEAVAKVPVPVPQVFMGLCLLMVIVLPVWLARGERLEEGS